MLPQMRVPSTMLESAVKELIKKTFAIIIHSLSFSTETGMINRDVDIAI